MKPLDFLNPLLGGTSSDGPLQALPEDPAWYVDLTAGFYNAYWEWRQTAWNDGTPRKEFLVWYSAQEQLMHELRNILSENGHSFGALLWVVEWASCHNEDEHWGISPLAAISCVVSDVIPNGYTASELFERFERYMSNQT